MKIKTAASKIKELAGLAKDTDIEEISYSRDGLKVGIKRMPPKAKKEKSQTPSGSEKSGSKKKDAPSEYVYSHSVGRFRDFSLPSRKSLVKKGQTVKKGQKMGMIESMKLLKEIIAPCEGKVIEKYVKQGEPVEYGQKLFKIEIV